MYERRDQRTNGIICFDDIEAGSVIGILPCAQPGCDERTGVACVQLDRRGRLCPTAWCPEHRRVSGDEPMCPFHAQRAEPRIAVGPAHPLTELVESFAELAEDDVATVLQDVALRDQGLVVAEALRAEIDAERGLSCWRAWRVDVDGRTALRVEVRAEGRRDDVIEVTVDGSVVNTVEGARAVINAACCGAEALLREVLAPVSFEIECRRFERMADLSGIGHARKRARR